MFIQVHLYFIKPIKQTHHALLGSYYPSTGTGYEDDKPLGNRLRKTLSSVRCPV